MSIFYHQGIDEGYLMELCGSLGAFEEEDENGRSAYVKHEQCLGKRSVCMTHLPRGVPQTFVRVAGWVCRSEFERAVSLLAHQGFGVSNSFSDRYLDSKKGTQHAIIIQIPTHIYCARSTPEQQPSVFLRIRTLLRSDIHADQFKGAQSPNQCWVTG
eukprot:956456-Prorocentrum_minimum.AAC.2